MTTVITPADAGIATFETSDDYTFAELFNSAVPEIVTEDFPVAASTTLAARTVVGLDASGNLAIAHTSATAVVPIGIMVTGVVTGAGQTTRAPIYRAGNFNSDALIFHADYSTDALKAAAFRGSPAPTNIVVRKRL